MVSPLTVFISVFTMLLLILPGYLLRKINFLNGDAAKVCSLIVLYCAQPCMIVDAYLREFDQTIFTDMLKVGALALVIYAVFMLIAAFMFKKAPDDKRGVLRYMMIFANCGFMGFPVLRQMFAGEQGELAVLLGSSVVLLFNLFSWTVGVRLYSKDKLSFKKVILNPGVIGALGGLFLFLTSAVKIIPSPVTSAISLSADAVTPMSMFAIGIRLAECSFKNIFGDWRLILASAMRLVVLPVISCIILYIAKVLGFPMNDMVMFIPFILLAMPSGATTSMMAERYGGDSVYGSAAVSLTTVASIATIPLVSILLTLI